MSQLDLSDGEIRERVSVFESEEFPPDDCIFFAEYLAKCQQGAVAEEAVQRLVDHFPEDRLSELVRKYAAPTLAPGLDHCQGYPGNHIAVALRDRGFEAAQSNTGWHVSWPGGDAVEGENLCRLALRVVWLRGMRSRSSGMGETKASGWGGMTATEKTRENRLGIPFPHPSTFIASNFGDVALLRVNALKLLYDLSGVWDGVFH